MMQICSFNNRIGIEPKKIGPIHEQLAYAFMMIIVFSVLSLISLDDFMMASLFSSLTALAVWRAAYVIKHQHDWFLRGVKAQSKNELRAYMLIENEL